MGSAVLIRRGARCLASAVKKVRAPIKVFLTLVLTFFIFVFKCMKRITFAMIEYVKILLRTVWCMMKSAGAWARTAWYHLWRGACCLANAVKKTLAPIKVFFTSVFTWMKRVMLATQEYAKNLLHALRSVMKSAGVRAWSHVRTAFHSISKRKAVICDLVRSVKSSCRFAISP